MSPQEYWLAVWKEDPDRLERYRALYQQSAKRYKQHMADIKHCHTMASKSSQNAPESSASEDGQLGPPDPLGIPQHAPGAKMDAGKDLAGLMWGFSRALEAVVAVGTYGARKYTRDGWNHVPDAIQRYQDAADRHTLAMAREELDPESGMPHEWHATWNRLAVLELKLRQQNQS